MARIASAKSRRNTFVVDEPLSPGEVPDTLALYLPDGTPIDLTADPSKMRWLGAWNDSTEYVTNDVVMYANQLYIISDLDVVVEAGADVPSLNDDWFLLTVPVTTPPPGMRWENQWSAAIAYEENQVVYHKGVLWYAPGDVNAGLEPGLIVADPTVLTARGQAMGQSKRLSEETDKLLVIGPPPGMHLRPNYRFSPDWLGGFILDSNGVSLNGVEVTVTPKSFVGATPKSFELNCYDSGSNFYSGLSKQWSEAEVAAKTPKSVIINTGTADLAFFTGFSNPLVSSGHGTYVDGEFYARVSDDTNLLDSPFTGESWVPIIAGAPWVDTRANRLLAMPIAGRQWKESDTGLVYMGDGTNWVVYNPLGQLRKTADFTLPQSDTVFDSANNVPQFSWPVGASEVWLVDVFLRLEGVSDIADIKVDFSLPSGSTYEIQRGSDALGETAVETPVAISTSSVDIGLISGKLFARVTALITVGGTAGTAQMRAAQVTSTAENVKVLTNSMLFPRRIA